MSRKAKQTFLASFNLYHDLFEYNISEDGFPIDLAMDALFRTVYFLSSSRGKNVDLKRMINAIVKEYDAETVIE